MREHRARDPADERFWGMTVNRVRTGRLPPGVAVTGLVLAGGRGRRQGGRDKGLINHLGLPMATRAVGWLEPHSNLVVISANRNLSRYRALADVIVSDRWREHLGPLAGISACLHAVRTRWLLTCPCDASGLPSDLPLRLLRTLHLHGGADAAVVRDPCRLQPLLAAFRGGLAHRIDAYLGRGGRSAHGLLAELTVVEVAARDVIGNRNG